MENEQHAVTQPLRFDSAWHCPSARRAWMALVHQGFAYVYIEGDRYRESKRNGR